MRDHGLLVIMMAAGAALAACSPAGTPAGIATHPVSTATLGAASASTSAAPSGADLLVYVPGSTHKVCQLTGDIDWETGQPTAARTLANFGLDAADLGYPVEHQGKLILLFGDSWPPPHPPHLTQAQSEVPPDDSVGMTVRTAPPNATDGKCLQLQINADASGKFAPATIIGPIQVKQGFFNVPSGGVSVGDSLFAFFWTDHCTDPNPLPPAQQDPLARPPVDPTHGCPETDARNSVGTSVLAQSHDEGRTFSDVVSMPAGFVYVTAVNTDLQSDIPTAQRLGVFVFGVPRYRASIPYLAFAPTASFADPKTWSFFAGLDAGGQPKWASYDAWMQGSSVLSRWNPPGSPELFAVNSSSDRCVGEMSVTWNSVLKQWLMLYGCPQGQLARIAAAPWGPWSAPVTILTLRSDVACKLVMTADGCGSRRNYWPVQSTGKFVAGGFYAPFVLNRYTTAASGPAGSRAVSIYWLVSTWNPYEVDVMETTLDLGPSPARP